MAIAKGSVAALVERDLPRDVLDIVADIDPQIIDVLNAMNATDLEGCANFLNGMRANGRTASQVAYQWVMRMRRHPDMA